MDRQSSFPSLYRVGVRDHFMIAHSFEGATFGPAQQLHGATYVVDLEVYRTELDDDGVVVDIGLLSQTLKQLLAELNFHNLDDLAEFSGQNTTTEFMARVIFKRMQDAIERGGLGASARGLSAMSVTLNESHIAWASYQAPLKLKA